MQILYKRLIAAITSSMLLMAVALPAAHADDDERYGERSAGKRTSKYGGENRGKPLQPREINAKFQQECSACHIAYAPGLLPAESWRRMMAGLDKHFGSDATLDASDNREITAFLVENASNRWRATTAPMRITETSWFKAKHGSHEISPRVWKNPKVKLPSNCGACHTQADKGDFKERNIRMPR